MLFVAAVRLGALVASVASSQLATSPLATPQVPARSAATCALPGDGARMAAENLPLGERLKYSVHFGPLHVATANMELTTGDSIRGRPAYHALLHITGGTLFFRVDDRIESWFDTRTQSSLRFVQSLHEGRYKALREFEIFPERTSFQKKGEEEQPSVPLPLDDASFLYFLRTLPLAVGAEFECDRYFRPDANPVIIRVVRRETVEVPAGTFDAFVLQPEIKTSGMFSNKGRAEVWINANGAHELVQLKSHLNFGSISLYLDR
ncbi:MAG: hypothetical protein JWO05_3805 [Gemmatimonadetes bacterium]|nr:hypothetical protein [Gemmatimonadota bacterium]